ncbi:ANTAR domain-containing protein [Arthrobacter sp. MPF02]|uniref:GAF and ANTAR domain-containing protein n=1 Tax=Arthrobacter sp. MPF02 TaxID=3388492 RepID=UPI003984D15C
MVEQGTDRDDRLNARLLDLLLEIRDPGVFLEELAVLAAAAYSGAGLRVGCGLTLMRRKKPSAVAGSDSAAAALDQLQERCHGGPSRLALRTGQTADVPDVGMEARWPLFTDAARRHGVAAILAVPLELADGAQGVMTLYAGQPNAFAGDRGIAAFAVHAGKALRVVLHAAELEQAQSDMAAAMQSRTAIDVATGVLMAENRCSQDKAFDIMRRASNNRNLKLRDLARQITGAVSAGGEVTAHFDA